jgi:hypothetical protein
MKLYYLACSVNSQDTGKNYPQVQKTFPLLDYRQADSIYRMLDQEFKFIEDFNPRIDYAELAKGSRPSDFLSSSMFQLNGFLISERSKDFFLRFTLPQYKFYKIPVLTFDEQTLPYFWFHMLFTFNDLTFQEIQNKNTLYDKSQFHVSRYFQKLDEIKIHSSEEFESKKKDLENGTSVRASSLSLKKDFLSQTPDIFKIPVLNSVDWIIKEHMKNQLEESHLTGFTLTEIANVIFE